ncbi:hypothetical protein ENUP19_0044G0034 [Entamoeba nuttalli]|uniref:RhoGAP domain containing protein n=1 Tax=Entamoeba nuttalli TaxID=412467 RepID=A0ABQ0DAS1_9EUKA
MISVESVSSHGFSRPRSFTKHSRGNTKNLPSLNPAKLIPLRRLTIDSSQISTPNDSTRRQPSFELSSKLSLISSPENNVMTRRSILKIIQEIKDIIKIIISIEKQCVGIINRISKNKEFDKGLNLTDKEKSIILEFDIKEFDKDELIQYKENLIHSINIFEEILTALKISVLSLQNTIKNSFNPMVLSFTIEVLDKFTQFNKNIQTTIMNFRNWSNKSLIHQKVYQKNNTTSLEDLMCNCAEFINICIRLFESDRIGIEQTIDLEDILIQFKGITSYKIGDNESISLSDLRWIKSNLITASSFTSQLSQSVDGLNSFLNYHDILNSLKASRYWNKSLEIYDPIINQINEHSIIHAGIAFLRLQTNDEICRYQKCYLYYLNIGLLILLSYAGNTFLPCDFISAKRLVTADIEIDIPQDHTFAGDLHILTKDSIYRKTFCFSFQHESDIIEWSNQFKETLSSLDITTTQIIELGNPVSTKFFNKKVVIKKNKYIGSSIEELVQFQQFSSCLDNVPDVLNKCINEIINKGLTEDGLFRKPPDQYQLEELIKKLNDSDFRNELKLTEYPVGTICGLLKSLLMEMNPRFINGESYKLFSDISKKKGINEQRKQIKFFIESLNNEHRNTLSRYLFLMNIIAVNQRLNRMGESNLSTAICQCFLPPKQSVDFASVENDSFECLISNYDLFIPSKLEHPIQTPSLFSLIKKQTKTNNTVIISCFNEIKNVMWLLECDGTLTEVNVNTLQSSVIKLNLPFNTIKQIESYDKYNIIASNTSLLTIDVETKKIIQMIKRKEINCLMILNNNIIIGEQNGMIELFEIPTLKKKGELFVIPKKLDASQKIPSIIQITGNEEAIYVLYENNCEIGFVSMTNGSLIQTIKLYNQSKITCFSYIEENQTLWVANNDGDIKIFNGENGIIIEEYKYPLTYGSVVFIASIPKYIIVVFNSSQILLFNLDTISLVCSISNKYFITSKWAKLVKRNYYEKIYWNLWLEKDGNGDIGIIDIGPFNDFSITDERLIKIEYKFHNNYIEHSPIGHSFNIVSIDTNKKCCVCQKNIEQTCCQCINCNQYLHQNCISTFIETRCKGHFKIIHEIINRSK